MPFETAYARPRARAASARVPVVVYGTTWCGATHAVRRHLERLGIPYDFADLERDPDAVARVQWWTGGSASHPTVNVGGDVLVEPTLGELDWALERNGVA